MVRIRRRMFFIMLCILLTLMITGCSKDEDKIQGDYKLVSIESDNESKRNEEFFKVYEKYGIFYASLVIENDGKACLKPVGTDELLLTYDDNYLIDPNSGEKIEYKFENGELSFSVSSLLGSSKCVFKKMTSDESEKLKKGYSEEDYQKAEKEAEEIIAKYIESIDINNLSSVEKTRIAKDKQSYDELYEAILIISFDNEIKKLLEAGHSYKISFSKNGTVVYIDNKEVSDTDPFCIQLEERIKNYKEYKVCSGLDKEYIIDITSEGTVQKTVEPQSLE